MKPFTCRTSETDGARIRIHLASLGCAKNLVDSERILGRLAAAGAIINAPPAEADIIIVNTCGFIQPAKEESLETILRLAQFKRTGRCRRLLVMGCLAQRYAAELRRQISEADGVFGLDDHDDILAACGFPRRAAAHVGRFLLTPRHSAYLRIADGCDNCCAYCSIPLIRGRFRSRPADALVSEARSLVAHGARELNVIGQDTTLYGSDLRGSPRIHALLRALARTPKLRWLRLLYTHPAHFSSELIKTYAATPRLVPYVDLPLQHFSDQILRRMGRKVTQAQILDLIGRIRAGVPGVAVRTSLITGFPGETRAQFGEMLTLVQRLRFEYLGVFAYSREDGTRAARMRGQVSRSTAEGRRREIMAVQQEIAFARNRALVGADVELLVDEARPDGSWLARSAVQSPDVDSATILHGAGLRPGMFVRARVTDWKGYDLVAKVSGMK